jgi:glutamate--cysteine ligase
LSELLAVGITGPMCERSSKTRLTRARPSHLFGTLGAQLPANARVAMVPHLVTALTGPINELEARILESMPAIERWFRLEWMEHTPPFYSSVDLRNAGFKLAPVDTNLYPGGWNNLTREMLPLAVQAAMAAIEKICPEAKNLLLLPEKHTRNTFYLSNVARLKQIFSLAGLNVRLGTLDPDIQAPTDFELPDGQVLTVEPLIRGKRRLGLKDFDPCTILLNNDLSSGIPTVLENLHEQYVLPPLHAGWAVRRKTNHFRSYEEVAKKFAKLLGMDAWLINPMHSQCGKVDFAEGQGIECVQSNVDALLSKVRRKYKEYGINEKPFVVVKADNGTYGMGIMTVRDAKELDELNRRTRNKMSVIKEGQTVSEVIIQEGVPTYERMNDAVAEPVVYMMDRYVVGGFYRVHAERGIDENLNSPGAQFVPLAFAESHHLPRPGEKPGASAPNRFYMYGVIGRLAMLAASYELEATDPEAEAYR